MGGALTAAAWLLSALVVPGALALDLLAYPARGAERWAYAVGLSVCLWPLVLLWGSLAGLAWTPQALRAALTFGSLAVVAMAVRRARIGAAAGRESDGPGSTGPRRRRPPRAESVALVVVLLLAVVLRWHQAKDLVVPAWVDGLHHSVVAHVVAASGRLPTDLRPFVELDRFYYHFGFHALAGAVASAAGIASASAVLWSGQALSVVSVLTVFALARRLAGSAVVAVAAAAVPATLYTFPAYFVSWSRYTQLAGLVVLPIAWLLVADLDRSGRSWRAQLLAGVAAAGLVLVHYRVAVFYALGVGVWVAWQIATRRRRCAPAVGRVVSVAVLSFALAAPWLLHYFAGGVGSLADASPGWLSAPAGVGDLPAWLFTTYGNAVWIGLAMRGVVIGLARRLPAAFGLVVTLALAVVLVRPDVVGLPASWVLPPFSLAIGLYIPVAIGVALLADAAVVLARPYVGADRARRGLAAAVIAVAAAGAVQTRDIRNDDTVIATAADVAAARWVAENTPGDAVFLVSTSHWHLGTYRGLDGGYWLGVLAGRRTSIPPALYPYGEPSRVRQIDAAASTAAGGDDLTDQELRALMADVGASYVYTGPAGRRSEAKLSAARLRRAPFLAEVYAHDGVHVFALRDPVEMGR